MEAEGKQRDSSGFSAIIDSTFYLTMASAYLILLSMVYDQSYFEAFDLPLTLISVEIKNIFNYSYLGLGFIGPAILIAVIPLIALNIYMRFYIYLYLKNTRPSMRHYSFIRKHLVNFQATISKRKTVLIYFCLLLFFTSAVLVFNLMGKADARKQTEFYVVVDQPSTVVIRQYSDKLICKEYDSKLKALNNKIIVINLSSMPKIELIKRHFGSLIIKR